MIINGGKIIADDTPANIKALSSSSSQTVLVEFAERVIPNQLADIPGIISIRHLSENKLLIIGGMEDLRTEIFHYAVKNGLTILTLTKQESSLEHVFLELIK